MNKCLILFVVGFNSNSPDIYSNVRSRYGMDLFSYSPSDNFEEVNSRFVETSQAYDVVIGRSMGAHLLFRNLDLLNNKTMILLSPILESNKLFLGGAKVIDAVSTLEKIFQRKRKPLITLDYKQTIYLYEHPVDLDQLLNHESLYVVIPLHDKYSPLSKRKMELLKSKLKNRLTVIKASHVRVMYTSEIIGILDAYMNDIMKSRTSVSMSACQITFS